MSGRTGGTGATLVSRKPKHGRPRVQLFMGISAPGKAPVWDGIFATTKEVYFLRPSCPFVLPPFVTCSV